MGSLLRFRRDDSGMALFIAMAAIALMFLLTTTAFYFASQTLFEAKLADQHDVAFQAASSGEMVAFADLQARLASLPTDGPHTYRYAGTIATSTASYAATATYNVASSSYDCTSTGTSADGTREVIVASFKVNPGVSTSMWTESILSAGKTVDPITGSGAFTGPIYFKYPGTAFQNVLDFGSAGAGFTSGPIYIENANLILKNVPPVPIDIYTNGTITLDGAVKNRPEMIINHGWDPSYAITLAPVNQLTFLASALQSATVESADNRMGSGLSTVVNYESRPVGTPGSYTSPSTSPPNTASWIRKLAPGAKSASGYKYVAGDLELKYDKKTDYSFGSWSGDGHYPNSVGLHDDFAYDAANGVLYVEGTVYIDGNFTVSTDLKYVGSGTIVCRGDALFHDSFVPATADGSPAPGYIVGVFAKGNVVVDSDKVFVTGAVYTTSQLQVNSNNVTLTGSFISENGMSNFPNGLNIIGVPAIGGYPPAGLPGGSTGSSVSGVKTLSLLTWRRL